MVGTVYWWASFFPRSNRIAGSVKCPFHRASKVDLTSRGSATNSSSGNHETTVRNRLKDRSGLPRPKMYSSCTARWYGSDTSTRTLFERHGIRANPMEEKMYLQVHKDSTHLQIDMR